MDILVELSLYQNSIDILLPIYQILKSIQMSINGHSRTFGGHWMLQYPNIKLLPIENKRLIFLN